MTKYRPERIQLSSPTDIVGEFEELLNKYLHKAAKLSRVDENGRTTFTFYPTKSEYFIISMLFLVIGKKYGTLQEPKDSIDSH